MKKSFHIFMIFEHEWQVYVCMASKLPQVVPIRIKSGSVYNLIMIAFKKGLTVRYSNKYLSVSMSFSMRCFPVESFKTKF